MAAIERTKNRALPVKYLPDVSKCLALQKCFFSNCLSPTLTVTSTEILCQNNRFDPQVLCGRSPWITLSHHV